MEKLTFLLSENLFTWKGRANRSQYALVSAVLITLTLLAEFALSDIVALVLLVPMIPVSVMLTIRRLHDVGHSGWWALLSLVPLVSFALMVYLLLRPGQPGPNAYGAPLPVWLGEGEEAPAPQHNAAAAKPAPEPVLLAVDKPAQTAKPAAAAGAKPLAKAKPKPKSAAKAAPQQSATRKPAKTTKLAKASPASSKSKPKN